MTGVVDAIFAVFTKILDWFIASLGSVSTVFYADGALTFIGTITIVGLGIALVTLVLAWVRSLLARGSGR